MSEAELREHVVQLAHSMGWRVFSLPIARTRRPVKDAVGYPDLTLARRGRVVWLELKTEKGILTDVQMDWFLALPSCHVIRPSNLGDLEKVLS